MIPWMEVNRRINYVTNSGIATDYGLDDRMIRVRILAGSGNFSLRHSVKTGSAAHSASYPVGTGALSRGVKRPGSEADHSYPI
jgi:hypothetical protein